MDGIFYGFSFLYYLLFSLKYIELKLHILSFRSLEKYIVGNNAVILQIFYYVYWNWTVLVVFVTTVRKIRQGLWVVVCEAVKIVAKRKPLKLNLEKVEQLKAKEITISFSLLNCK